MTFGKMLGKMARNEPLTPKEISKVELMGNVLESDDAYVRGLQSGNSDIFANDLRSQFGYFNVPPNNGSYFGGDLFGDWAQDIPNNSDTKYTGWGTAITTPQSAVVWYDSSASQFMINPNFAKNTDAVIQVLGYYQTEAYTAVPRTCYINWKAKSDDSALITYSVAYGVTADQVLGFNAFFQLNDFTDNPADYYFDISVYQKSGGTTGAFVQVTFSRFI